MTITVTESTNNFGWIDPNSPDYRPEIIQLIENVAANKTHLAKTVWQIEVEQEDIVSELYAHLLTYPKLLENGKVPSKILHDEAAKYCFKQRANKGSAILGTDSLHGILTEFNSMPSYVHKVLYGPVFIKAGKPAGTYLEIIEQEYKYKNKVVGASQRKTLSRAVTRLAEVISGIMVGTPDSLDAYAHSAGVPSYSMTEIDDVDCEDETFAPYVGIYHCVNDHAYRIRTGDKPENRRIGLKTELGYYKCRCDEVLYLDTRE